MLLHKLFGVRRHKPPSRRQVPTKSGPAPAAAPAEHRSSALKIIHAGGQVESYYMAVPANRIMEKYPSLILARPDVFRKPWEAVVRPEEILVPGQKFYLVPRRTMKKLRQKIRKPGSGGRESSTTHSFASQSFTDVSAEVVFQQKDDFSSKSFLQLSDISISSVATSSSKANGKKSDRSRRVRFFGIDTKPDSDSDSDSVLIAKKGSEEESRKKSQDAQAGGGGGGKRSVRNGEIWQPSLTAIREIQGYDE